MRCFDMLSHAKQTCIILLLLKEKTKSVYLNATKTNENRSALVYQKYRGQTRP